MHRLGAKAGYRLLLMGTVITNKAVDVFSQYKFVDPAIFGQSFYAFRATKAECLDLPEMTDILRQVELGPGVGEGELCGVIRRRGDGNKYPDSAH